MINNKLLKFTAISSLFLFLTMFNIKIKAELKEHKEVIAIKNKLVNNNNKIIDLINNILNKEIPKDKNRYTELVLNKDVDNEKINIINYYSNKYNYLKKEELIYIVNTTKFYSELNNLDYKKVLVIIEIESNFKVNTTGGVGEIGLMQVYYNIHKDKTFKELNINFTKKEMYNINNNIKVGTFILKKCYNYYNKSEINSITCYNGNVGDLNKKYYNKFNGKYKELLNNIKEK